MALAINDLRAGLTIFVDNQCWMIVDAQHIKPGKGAAFCRARLRNIKTNNVLEMTFRGDDKIPEAYIEERKLQYQYSSGDMFHFMDQENYEDIAISADTMGDKAKFLKDNLDVLALFYEGDCLNVVLPFFVVYEITSTEPGIKGDTAKSGTKPAQIESGATVQVPLFVNQGDRIKIDTRTASYVERA